MPVSRSKKKTLRQAEKARMRNRAKASALRTAMRRLREAVDSGDAAKTAEALQAAYKRIDKAAKENVIHANTANRRKSLAARTAASVTNA